MVAVCTTAGLGIGLFASHVPIWPVTQPLGFAHGCVLRRRSPHFVIGVMSTVPS